MVYKILLDGQSLYDEDQDRILLSPSLNIELNAAGSLRFRMPYNHPLYNYPRIMIQIIEVYEANKLIWYGRPVEITTNFKKEKEIYCEGALAFFNDSVNRPVRYTEIKLHDYFRGLIASHNTQVSAPRQFTVGTIDVENKTVYRNLDYQDMMGCLIQTTVDAEGGHFVFRKENGKNYIDWKKEITDISNQPAQFGLNILDLSQVLTGEDIATSIIPIGTGGNGNKLTIKYINNGIDYLDASPEVLAEYGRITKMVQFDLSKREKLIEAGRKWLEDAQFDALSITVSVAELSYLEPSFDGFMVGQIVHCTSKPHFIDKKFPIMKMSINLDSAKKSISIGTVPRKTLTETYRGGRTETSYEEYEYDTDLNEGGA